MIRLVAAIVAVVALGACGSSSNSSSGPLDAGDWARDIDYLTRESERIHPNLFHSVARGQYLARASQLKADLPNLGKNEIITEIKRLVALPAVQEDGHSLVTMFQATGFRLYPLRLYEFSDGVYVIDANPPHATAIGQRVVQIGGKDMSQVNQILNPLITRDNDSNLKQKRTLYYVVPEILEATNVLVDAEQGDFLLQDSMGNLTTIVVSPVDREIYRNTLNETIGLPEAMAPLSMTDLVTPFWMQLLPSGELYIKYNWVFPDDGAGLTIQQFSNNIANSVVVNNPQKIIVDVRHNRGGDATTYGPLLNVLKSASINQAGKLYLLIGRQTFSAAANFVTRVDLETNTRFVGEPTGGSLNNFGDVVNFDLPRSGLGISIPTIYWQYAPGDPRISVDPDIPAEWSSTDYFNQLDPVLDAALND